MNDVAEYIKENHNTRSHRQRERQVPAWILNFARGERDIVPGIGREERSNLRDSQDGQGSDQDRGSSYANLHCMTGAESGVGPQMPIEIGCQSVGIPPKKQAKQNQNGES